MRKREKEIKDSLALRDKTRLTQSTPFSVKEAYKLTRTNILFSLAQSGCKYIAITSADLSEGKTTTCTNMAISFAQIGKRTLIIDADMRKPQIHNIFKVDNQVGLSNVLGGFVKAEETIKCLEEGLYTMTAGHIPPNPAELLASQAMKDLLDELGQQYDYIFIDTPPVSVVTDAIIISGFVSGMIIVVKQAQSKQPELQDALSKLAFAKAKVLGVILTRAQIKSGKYGKYGKYKGYSAYE